MPDFCTTQAIDSAGERSKCTTLDFRTGHSEGNRYQRKLEFCYNQNMSIRNTKIISERSTLSAFSPSDAPELYSCISLEITRFMSWEPPSSEVEFADVWKEWLRSAELGTEVYLVARDKENSQCLGLVGVHALHTSTPELGIWLRHDIHGKGLGKELIGAVLGWVSNQKTINFSSIQLLKTTSLVVV